MFFLSITLRNVTTDIHGAKNFRNAFEGNYKGIELKLISCDRLSFVPMLVR